MAVNDRINGLLGSVAIKPPCRVATTANITLSGLQTIDGVTVVAGDRVLVKDQTTATENGIYEADTSAWSRAKDFNGNRDAVQGTTIPVYAGTANGGMYYQVTNANPITIGTTSLTFDNALASTAGMISLTQGGTVQDAIQYATPEQFAPGRTTTEMVQAWLEHLNSTGQVGWITKAYSVDQIYLDTINKITIIAGGNAKLTLANTGQRLLYLDAPSKQGQFVVIGPMEFDGGGNSCAIDGGLIQSNNVGLLLLQGCKVHNWTDALGGEANGIATTGVDCVTVIENCELTDIDDQCLYLQTSVARIINPNIYSTQSHGIAFVDCSNFTLEGGSINTGSSGYGVLTYSTVSYRSKLKFMKIKGTNFNGSYKAFEIARRYEDASVAGGQAEIIIEDVIADNVTEYSTLGNAVTDNADGYSLRGVKINGFRSNKELRLYNVLDANLQNLTLGQGGIRVGGKVTDIWVDSYKCNGAGTTGNANTLFYFYDGATVDNFRAGKNVHGYNVDHVCYAENTSSGLTVSGPLAIDDYRTTGSALTYVVNSAMYNKIALPRGTRSDREMAKQSWSVGRFPFYHTVQKRLLYWDGTNQVDAAGVTYVGT